MSHQSAANFSQFIYFSNKTMGNNGRAVYIDPALLPRFLTFFNLSKGLDRPPETVSNFHNNLISLSSSAGNINSHSNSHNASEHRNIFLPFQVTYSVVQNRSSSNRGPGIYVTDIRRVSTGSDGKDISGPLPGFYTVEKNSQSRKWVAQDRQCTKMMTAVGAIGAVMNGINYSFEETVSTYGQKIEHLKGNVGDKFSLLYSPGYITDQCGAWESPEHKQVARGVLQENFVRTLLSTVDVNKSWASIQESGTRYKWYVFDDGAKFLEECIEKYNEISRRAYLYEHEFHFIDAKSNLGSLLTNLAHLGAELVHEEVRVEFSNHAAKVHQVFDMDTYAEGYCKFQGGLTFQRSDYEDQLKKHIESKYLRPNLSSIFMRLVGEILKDKLVDDFAH